MDGLVCKNTVISACVEGVTFSATGDDSNGCQTCSTCFTSVKSACTATSDTQCEPDMNYMIATDGICPTEYSPLTSLSECEQLAGQTVSQTAAGQIISDTVLSTYGFAYCASYYTPSETCFVYFSTNMLYYTNQDCGQVPDYDNRVDLVCKLACVDGSTFSATGDDSNGSCQTCTTCTTTEVAPCTATSDAQCAADPKYIIAQDGICPFGYLPLTSLSECQLLAGQTISETTAGQITSETTLLTYQFAACASYYTPPDTCSVKSDYIYYTDGDCGQVPDYDIMDGLVCKNTVISACVEGVTFSATGDDSNGYQTCSTCFTSVKSACTATSDTQCE